jgi:arsenite-transporting ATPase
MQEKYLEEIKDTFTHSEIVKVFMYDKEIKGIDMLSKIGDSLF